MTHPIPTGNYATTQNSNVETWIQLADCFLKTIKTLAKTNSDTNKGDDDSQKKSDDERPDPHQAAFVIVLSGSAILCEALADPLSFFARAICFLVRQARRDVLELRWIVVTRRPAILENLRLRILQIT